MPDLSQVLGEASTMASQVDLLFFTLLASSSATAVVILGLIVYFGVKYRRRPDNQIAEQLQGSTRLEVAWTVIPLILALGIFVWGARLYFNLAVPPADALDVYVVAKQWMWQIQHAEGAREINSLHVPVGQPVRLTMTSQDVIHSFYVPAFRVKQDVLPRRYTTMWFQATEPGTYHLFCAEYCGTMHSGMIGEVVVMSQQDYQDWLGQGVPQDPVAAGARLFTQYGCIGCHHADNSGPAPSLVGVFGHPVHLQDGTTVIADENYIHTSIVNPTAQIVAGYQPIMPSFEKILTPDQLMSLLIYIKSLANGAGAAPTAPASTPTTRP